MFDPDQYELLDFGAGRKLERFGPYLLDRPSPAAEGTSLRHPELWSAADARYERIAAERGQWQAPLSLPECWCLRHGVLRLELKRSDFGHVGLFAEQAANWDWIAEQTRVAQRPLKVLNLFAYTGTSTLAAAVAGCRWSMSTPRRMSLPGPAATRCTLDWERLRSVGSMRMRRSLSGAKFNVAMLTTP